MKTTRHQKGYVYKKGRWWFVRFYDSVMQADGSTKRAQVARKVAPVSDDYRSKRSVLLMVEELLRPFNNGHYTPESTLALERFVEQTYLPYIQSQRRPSTYKSYKELWENHVERRCGATRLREFRTCDGERLLADIARQHNLSRSTLRHIKTLLSGIFKQAKRLGVLNGVNPMQDVSVPMSKASGETYAYSLEEVQQMIGALPEPATTIVATAAFTGLRRGELRGLLWENYNGAQIRVTQSVWESHITEPKNKQSKAPVPLVPLLAGMLDGYRMARNNPRSGLMFASRKSTPLNLNNLLNRVIKPTFAKSGLQWHGWHAFRRGLATNLYRLGVPDKTIQAILRHGNISTTMNIYVKSVPADAVAAMRSLGEVCTSMHQPAGKFGERVV